MKNETLILSLLVASLGLAPAQGQDLFAMRPLEELQPANVREVEAVELARFDLSNGNEVYFLGVPQDDELMIEEIADAGREVFVIDPEWTAAEIFHRLAPADLPVPRMIAETDDGGLLAYRSVVDRLEKPVAATDSDLVGAQPMGRSGSGSCASGSAGANYFRTHHCFTLGGPGYGASEQYCYDGAWNTLQRDTSSKRRATYTRMASCGGSWNRVRHSYSTTSGFHTQLDRFIEPQKVVSHWSAKGGVKRYRRARMEELGASGWVRGWMKHHSERAEGW